MTLTDPAVNGALTDPKPPPDPGPSADPGARRGPGRPPKAATAPRATARPPSEPKTPGRPRKNDLLAEQLTATFAMVGTVVMAFNFEDGISVVQGSERLAVSLVHVGETNPQVLRALNAMVQTTAWSEVAMAVALIALPILAHHGILPTEMAAMAATVASTEHAAQPPAA